MIPLLTKPLAIGIVFLGLLNLGQAGYMWYQNKAMDNLKVQVSNAESTIEGLSDTIESKDKLYDSTLESLAHREQQNRIITNNYSRLQREVNEILKNSSDECLTKPLPDGVSERL